MTSSLVRLLTLKRVYTTWTFFGGDFKIFGAYNVLKSLPTINKKDEGSRKRDEHCWAVSNVACLLWMLIQLGEHFNWCTVIQQKPLLNYEYNQAEIIELPG